MNQESLGSIFLSSCLVNNFVLAYFLGICPFLGVSGKLATAIRMGGAVTFVMFVTSICAFCIQWVLKAIGAPYLQLVSFIVVIAATVQLVEMFIKRTSPVLFRALGIFLPLITTNCAILGLALFQTNKGYGFLQSLVFALGAGA
ncbi:MAG TPA: Rnf-Nqr domain containing protein, partial [Gemmatales bacterium]|nr:Rnf-Nqr domain containing protein [Gemmatales bacterium]